MTGFGVGECYFKRFVHPKRISALLTSSSTCFHGANKGAHNSFCPLLALSQWTTELTALPKRKLLTETLLIMTMVVNLPVGKALAF